MGLRRPFRPPYQDILRLRHIAQVLIKNGLGFFLERWGLTRILALRGQRLTPEEKISRRSIPGRVRRTLEELGPTYIKLGQLMSTRPDILPPNYVAEFSKLLDAVPPFPAQVAVQQIEQELGKPITTLFASFNPQPMASASIGQVHQATLPTGERVVVKVQRPGIQRIIESDFGLLLRQARFLESHSETLRDYQLVDILQEFGQGLQDELDYVREGNNADRLRQVLRANEHACIPKVYWEYTTRCVITLEEVSGVKLNDLERLKSQGHDLAALATIVADMYMHQVFVAGIFHADPHPANLLVHDSIVSLVDFGLMGFLTTGMKERLAELFIALMAQDVPRITDVVLQLGATRAPANREGLQRDIQRLLYRYYGLSLENVSLGEFLEEIMETAFRHRIRLPSDLALLARTMIVLEGLVLQLNPRFDYVEFAKPYLRRMVQERLSPLRWGQEIMGTLQEYHQLWRSLPRHSSVLLHQLETGEATVGIEVRRFDIALRKLDAITNRLAFSVIIAALIIGSSLIMQAGAESSTWHLPILGWGIPIAQIVFIFAGILGGWLLLSIVRSRGL